MKYRCQVRSPGGFRGMGAGCRFTAELITYRDGSRTAQVTIRLAFTSRVFHVSPGALAVAIEAGHVVATKENE